jgi:hypothetical protein
MDPTNVGMLTSKNLPAASIWYSGPIKSTSADHIVQMEKPMCSERIENHRLRFAIFAPVRSQKPSSSGFQSSIQFAFRGDLVMRETVERSGYLLVGSV